MIKSYACTGPVDGSIIRRDMQHVSRTRSKSEKTRRHTGTPECLSAKPNTQAVVFVQELIAYDGILAIEIGRSLCTLVPLSQSRTSLGGPRVSGHRG